MIADLLSLSLWILNATFELRKHCWWWSRTLIYFSAHKDVSTFRQYHLPVRTLIGSHVLYSVWGFHFANVSHHLCIPEIRQGHQIVLSALSELIYKTKKSTKCKLTVCITRLTRPICQVSIVIDTHKYWQWSIFTVRIVLLHSVTLSCSICWHVPLACLGLGSWESV